MTHINRSSYIDSTPYQEHCYAYYLLKESQRLSRQEPYHRDDALTEEFGFIVPTPPLTHMPQSHSVWDEFANNLPGWVRKGTQRHEIEKMDLLPASELFLPREYLCRGVTIISHLAHAYYLGDYLNGEKPVQELPNALEKPWQILCRRLNRPRVGMTGFESILYNWKLRDSTIPNPRYLENMDLLIPFFGNQEERMFNLSFLEVSLAGSPLLGSCIEAQDAVVNKDNERLLHVMKRLIYETGNLTHAILKMDPVPNNENYFNPIIWSKTAPEVSRSLRPSEAGLSGGSSPVIQLMDVFLDRLSYKTEMGRQEIERRYWMPLNHQHILNALSSVSVKDYIHESKNHHLVDLFNQLYETLNGKKGFLNIHRRKIYVYMELGFKAGRMSTNAGASRNTNIDPWVVVDEELEEGRKERYQYKYSSNQYCTIEKIHMIGHNTMQVDLKLDSGAVFFPGDRCELYLQNTEELIEKTLSALGANNRSLVRISNDWREYFAKTWPEYSHDVIMLRDFLHFAKIRPLDREVAKIFYDLTQIEEIKEILDDHKEDQFELWDFLELIKPHYDTTQLWEIAPWQKENISRILPPNQPRVYSIASSSQKNQSYYSNKISLTISKFAYDTSYKNKTRHRVGLATSYLSQTNKTGEKIKIDFQTPSNFDFRKGITHPIFLFASGSGISTFMSLFQYLEQIERGFKPRLFYSCTDFDNFLHKDYLLELAIQKKISLFLVFTRILESDLTEEQRRLLRLANAVVEFNEHMDDLIAEKSISELILHHIFLPKENKEAGYIYICGKTYFYKSILDAIEKLVNKKQPKKANSGANILDKLFAEKRIQSEVFSEYVNLKKLDDNVEYIFTSEVVDHNNDQNGYWIIIRDIVYDVTKFINRHPGGNKILIANCGKDGTGSYKNVEHHLWPEIESMLNAFRIGMVKPVTLSNRFEVCILDEEIISLSEKELYDFWVKTIYSVVDMENNINNSYSIPLGDEEININIVYDIHKLVPSEFLPIFISKYLLKLLSISASLYDKELKVVDISEKIKGLLKQIELAPDSINAVAKTKNKLDVINKIILADKKLLSDIKYNLKNGLINFEEQKDPMLLFDILQQLFHDCSDYASYMSGLYNN